MTDNGTFIVLTRNGERAAAIMGTLADRFAVVVVSDPVEALSVTMRDHPQFVLVDVSFSSLVDRLLADDSFRGAKAIVLHLTWPPVGAVPIEGIDAVVHMPSPKDVRTIRGVVDALAAPDGPADLSAFEPILLVERSTSINPSRR